MVASGVGSWWPFIGKNIESGSIAFISNNDDRINFTQIYAEPSVTSQKTCGGPPLPFGWFSSDWQTLPCLRV